MNEYFRPQILRTKSTLIIYPTHPKDKDIFLWYIAKTPTFPEVFFAAIRTILLHRIESKKIWPLRVLAHLGCFEVELGDLWCKVVRSFGEKDIKVAMRLVTSIQREVAAFWEPFSGNLHFPFYFLSFYHQICAFHTDWSCISTLWTLSSIFYAPFCFH